MEEQVTLSLGKYLKSEREKKQVTIEQIASATKINLKLLHALEEDNYEFLPAKPFIRGFIKSYLKYLGLDATDILTKHDSFLDEKNAKALKHPAGTPHIFVGTGGQRDSSKTTLSIVMGGFLFIAAIVFVILKPSLKHRHSHSKEKMSDQEMTTVLPPATEIQKTTPSTEPINQTVEPIKLTAEPVKPTAEPMKQTASKPVVTTQAPGPPLVPSSPLPTEAITPPKQETLASPQLAAQPKPKPPLIPMPLIPEAEIKYRLIINADEDSWVKYQADDFPFQQFTLKKGKTVYIKARHNIRFSTGNPLGIRISRDNKLFRSFGSGPRLLIIPEEAESTFKDRPFVMPGVVN